MGTVVVIQTPVAPSGSKLETSVVPETARANAATPPRLVPGLLDSGTPNVPALAAAAGALVGRAAVSLPPHPEGSGSAPGLRVEVDSIFSGRASAPAAADAEVTRYAAGTSSVPSVPILSLSNPVVALKEISQVGEQAGEKVLPPLLQLPGLLSVLPGVEPADVERGMRAFLDQLEEIGQGWTGHGNQTGLSLWLLAGTAAVLACEMARRQLRSSAEVPALYAQRLPDSTPIPPSAR
jgi:hypothetical protein